MIPPNETQQLVFAYGIKPFASLSFLSASYVLYRLLIQKPEKLKRIYHRKILSMNICILIQSITDFIGTWAMPVGTLDRIGAEGNQATCTTQGFVQVIFKIAVPYYYSCLSIYSYIAVRNSFKEEKYRHIEKLSHLGAILVSLPVAITFAVDGGINPNFHVCFAADKPFGCSKDPDIPCEKGDYAIALKAYYTWAVVTITFMIPPMALILTRITIKRANKNKNRTVGKQKIIEEYRRKILKEFTAQSCQYLAFFWTTQIVAFIAYGHRFITNQPNYNLYIVGIVFTASQGLILLFVYLRLEAKKDAELGGAPLGEVKNLREGAPGDAKVTVADIREAAKHPKQKNIREQLKKNYSFSIFDGTVDESSPWAKFLNSDDDSEDELENSENDLEIGDDIELAQIEE
mmetsp:Transcript_36788/g.49243  ORF Transcript_36788/g.49243 Transcript_36788/m.49243 type:complete len:403 (+) Transcript_36788:94-1302(+)